VISVVVPVFREAACLAELHRRLKHTLASLTPDHEILFVEDGGDDDSWSIITELAAADVRTKGLKLTRNFGQHNAITAGLHHADGDWVAVMDADLQDPPEAIRLRYDKARGLSRGRSGACRAGRRLATQFPGPAVRQGSAS
jgi:dolichol-phosphate mannosyltransferase